MLIFENHKTYYRFFYNKYQIQKYTSNSFMSHLSTLNTVARGANIPFGYFSKHNIENVRTIINHDLAKEYKNQFIITDESLVGYMRRSLLDRKESIPKMNIRAAMFAERDVRHHQHETKKHFDWQQNYVHAVAVHDPVSDIVRYDQQATRSPNRLGQPKVGSTLRFYYM